MGASGRWATRIDDKRVVARLYSGIDGMSSLIPQIQQHESLDT